MAYGEEPTQYERTYIMNAVVNLVKKFPHTTLVGIGLLGAALVIQTIRLQLSGLTTHQIIRAAEDLDIDARLIKQMEDHGPYYKK
jgi:hypothetical protein